MSRAGTNSAVGYFGDAIGEFRQAFLSHSDERMTLMDKELIARKGDRVLVCTPEGAYGATIRCITKTPGLHEGYSTVEFRMVVPWNPGGSDDGE